MIINFSNIGSGSGGGGSYTLPVASQNTLGGVKIGSGLTIDSGGTLSVSGGTGGNENYVIVDALSAITNPTEGMIAYVRSSSAGTEVQYFYFPDPNDYPTEGYVGSIKMPEYENTKPVYVSSNQFYWDWSNDGNWHTGDFEGNPFEYKCAVDSNDASNSRFYVRFPAGSNLYIEEDGENNVATGTETETVWKYSQPVVYQNGVWREVSIPQFNVQEGGFTTSAETAAFKAEVEAYVARGIYPQVFYQGHVYNYKTGNSAEWIQFEGVFGYNSDWTLYFSDQVFDNDGFNSAGFRVDQNDMVSSPDLSAKLGAVSSAGTADGTNFTDYLGDSINDNVYRYGFRFPNPDNPDEVLSIGLINYWYRYKVECQDCEEGWRWYYVVGADVPIETTIYHGVWGYIDNEHIETLEWTSGSTYESQTYTKYVPQQ